MNQQADLADVPTCRERGYHVCLCHGMNLTEQQMSDLGVTHCLYGDWAHPELTDDQRQAAAHVAMRRVWAESQYLANREGDPE